MPPTDRVLLKLLLAGLACAAAARGARAANLLAALFQDHAVLQRDRPIRVWGRAAPGEGITVRLGASSAAATADASGRWRAALPALSAGGPFSLSVRGTSGATQTASDVLIGDVFLCSGQSNMELAVQSAGNARDEIEHAANGRIRMLTVEHAASPTPLASFATPVAWQVASAATVPGWSAVCFFFARELQRSVPVPIGLVHASWGGSNIRPWISAAGLQAVVGYGPSLDLLELYARDPASAQARFALEWQAWWRSKTGTTGDEPWNSRPAAARGAAHPAAPWRPAPPGLGDWRGWGAPELREFTGVIWHRTTFHLSAAQARDVVALELGPVNQVDETWINGQAVGNTFGYGTARTYPLKPGLLHEGDNVLVVNVLSTYGGGGLLGDAGSRRLRLATGATLPLGEAWDYRIVPAEYGYPPRAPWESVEGLTTLYNAMIAPLGPMGLRGVLWYQGESNTREAASYQRLLEAWMADWRAQFDPLLPFLIVQLPGYGGPHVRPTESDWAAVRDAQRRAVASVPRAALAVTIDLGEARNLHPTDKQDVGKRLARAARHLIYGESLSASGPMLSGVRREAGQVIVQFTQVEGQLVAYSHDGPIGFELCAQGAGTCRFVEARLEGNEVRLSIPAQMTATRVRYCWADNPICTLFDQAELPASPFETRIPN